MIQLWVKSFAWINRITLLSSSVEAKSDLKNAIEVVKQSKVKVKDN